MVQQLWSFNFLFEENDGLTCLLKFRQKIHSMQLIATKCILLYNLVIIASNYQILFIWGIDVHFDEFTSPLSMEHKFCYNLVLIFLFMKLVYFLDNLKQEKMSSSFTSRLIVEIAWVTMSQYLSFFLYLLCTHLVYMDMLVLVLKFFQNETNNY